METIEKTIRTKQIKTDNIKSSKVLVIGAGIIGSSALQHVCQMGVGHLGIIDFEKISKEELPLQTLYNTYDIGKLKVIVAKERLEILNPDCKCHIYNIEVTQNNIEKFLKEYDIIMNTTNNPAIYQLINTTCLKFKKPHLLATIINEEGIIAILNYKKNNKLFELNFSNNNKPNEKAFNNFVIPATLGAILANEAIQLMTKPVFNTNYLVNVNIQNYSMNRHAL